MKADMQRQWQQVRQQWRDNARLRVLAAVVVAILLFSFLQHLHQLQSEAKQDALRQWQRLQDVTQLSRESHWQEYAEQSEGALAQLQARLWHAESEGQAQAQLRDLLQQMLSKHGLTAMRINITSLPDEDSGLVQVRADLNGDYLPGAWQDFVFELSRHSPAVVIEHDSVNRTNAARNLYRLGLHAWFVVEAQQ